MNQSRYEFWFVVGSQFLYGPQVLETVARRGEEMARELSGVLPFPLVYQDEPGDHPDREGGQLR